MEINQINGKAPEQSKPNFEIIINSYAQRALDEGVEPSVTYPCKGYVVLVNGPEKAEIISHGDFNIIAICEGLLNDERFGHMLRLLALVQ